MAIQVSKLRLKCWKDMEQMELLEQELKIL